jgi:glutathione S-transferase
MRTLFHLWLSPACRTVRIVLGEKGLDCELRTEDVWRRRPEFIALNPAGEVPVLVDDDETVVAGAEVICEYLEETVAEPTLIPGNAAERAEVRRLAAWFSRKFNTEVTDNLLGEKLMKRFLGLGTPDSRAIRAGKDNIHYHLDYIGWLAERRTWLAGERLSLADVAASAHLSALDYIGDVPWAEHEPAKHWYARIKSRPSFRPILADRMPGEPPPKHYADLDF